MLQGGDFAKRNGTGGESIYGGTFSDERLSGDGTAVDSAGLLVMANRGPDTNGSQYFVTLAPARHLSGKHVVFGRVVSGMQHIEAIGAMPTDERDRPLSPVIVARAGELELRRPAEPVRARSPSPARSRDSRSRSRTPDGEEEERHRRKRARRERKEREREERRSERRAERKRRKERKRGGDGDGSDDEGRAHSRSRSRSRSPRRRRDGRSPSETLSELDARLEREEKERESAARRKQAEEMRRTLDAERQAVKDGGGVVYKGMSRPVR
jgi:peptidyl-prolyl isomerase G (cyclophilin G)